MGELIEFIVTNPRDGIIEVRWLVPLGRPKSGAYRTLLETLEELHGVERINIGRYSAVIEAAPHVIHKAHLAQLVTEALEECQTLKSDIRFARSAGTEVRVTNATVWPTDTGEIPEP